MLSRLSYNAEFRHKLYNSSTAGDTRSITRKVEPFKSGKMFNESKILIIGAGAAGFAAASRLIEKGLTKITILEAKDRIGGRIHTVDFSENIVDLGAQWVHGEKGNVVFGLASQYQVLDSFRYLNDLTKHVFVTCKGEIIPKYESEEALKIYYNLSDFEEGRFENADYSYGEYMTQEFYKIFEKSPFTTVSRATEFLDWMQKYDNTIQCSDSWFDVSAKGMEEYWQCQGDSVLNWKDNGYKTLFDILSQKNSESKDILPIMEKIEFSKAVYTIDYSSGNDVVVKTKDGSTYVASHVIFTPSLGVLKHDHTKMFKPPLPELKQRAIAGLNIGTVNKIFLEFPHRWWNEDLGTFHLLWSKEDMAEFLETHGEEYRWLCDICSIFAVDYQPRVLCIWIIGKGARYTELLSESDIFDGISLILEMFFGKAFNVVKPDRILRSKWYTDECFRGCYSFRSMTTEKMNVRGRDLSEPITTDNNKPILLFAGEATHEHYYSTVHGAVETGFREADRLMDYYRRLKSHL